MSEEKMGEDGKVCNEPRDLEIKIILAPDGAFKVESPIMRDQVAMLGILEQAKLAIIQYNTMQKIHSAGNPGIIQRLRKRF